MKINWTDKRPKDYVTAAEQGENYLQNKFARIRREQAAEQKRLADLADRKAEQDKINAAEAQAKTITLQRRKP